MVKLFAYERTAQKPLRPEKYTTRFKNHPKIMGALKSLESRHEYRAADLLRRLDAILVDDKYRRLFFDHIDEATLTGWMQDPPYHAALQVPYSMRLLPTSEILSFIKRGGLRDDTQAWLEAMVEDIQRGHFNPSDPLHMELEYSRTIGKGLNIPYNDFTRLPIIEEGKAVLGKRDRLEAEETAREALDVFNFIKGKIDGHVPLIVIGNERYGSYFVVSPIEEYLAALGVKVVHEHIPSIVYDKNLGHTNKGGAGYISDETWKFIAQHNPNVVVVDGTQNPKDDGRTRFPRAMWGYINAFNAYNAACGICPADPEDKWIIEHRLKRLNPSNGYRITLWAPEMTDEIFVGDYEYAPSSNRKEPREVALVCSTRMGGSVGAFDDPELYVKNISSGFGPKGLENVRIAPDERTFVAAVQGAMKEMIAKWMQEA